MKGKAQKETIYKGIEKEWLIQQNLKHTRTIYKTFSNDTKNPPFL